MHIQQPFLYDDAFLRDVIEADESQLHCWWLGQSGFLLKWKGRHLLFDPYLSDSLTLKYKDTDKEHTRMTARVIAPERLDFIDVVTTSHNHTDHLDAESLNPILQVNPTITLVGPEANRDFIAHRLDCPTERITVLDDGHTVTIGDMRFHGIAAAHDELETDESGRHQFLGFVVEWGPWTIYHRGDTRLYDGLADRLKRFQIDLAFLPINGWKAERRVAGNLNASEAVELACDVGIRHTVPHHFHMFAFNTVEPDAFQRLANEAKLAHTVLQNGERLSLKKS